jgi:protein O-mannosyl-transferase
LLSLAAAGRALLAQEQGGALAGIGEHGLLARLAQACYGLVFYIRKTVWPDNLGPLYEIPPREVLLGSMFWLSAIILAVIVAVAIRTRHRWPALAASLAAYAIILSPVLGLAQSGPQLVADRYSYLSCMGFAVLGGAILLHWCRRPSWAVVTRRKALLSLTVAIICVSLHHATSAQADIWRDELRLWWRGVKVSPNSAVANVNLADALAVRQQREKAIELYRRALELDPHDAVAHHHLADVYRAMGYDEEAIRHYLMALRIDPARTRACYTLAELFADSGRGDLAVIILRDGAQRRPNDVKIIDYLARLLASHPDDTVRDGPEALMWAERAVYANGDNDIPSLTTLSVALAENGRFDDAIRTAEQALDLAVKVGAEHQVQRLQRRLAAFRENKPFRM